LHITTYVATPSRLGRATTFRVTKLADPGSVALWCDDQPFPRWRAVGDDAIEIETEVGDHRFRIATRARRAGDVPGSRGGAGAATGTNGLEAGAAEGTESFRPYRPEPVASCSCCSTVAPRA
jgi:hypothetical protein